MTAAVQGPVSVLDPLDDIREKVDEIAVHLGAQVNEACEVWRKDWLAQDRASASRDEQRGPMHTLLEATTGAMKTGLTGMVTLVAYLACLEDPEAIPEVLVDVQGRTVQLVVKLHDRWLATLTVFLNGGESACLIKDTFVCGAKIEIDGSVSNRWMCGDPAHHQGEPS